MINPRFSEIDGQRVREQSLDEFLSGLDPDHCARQQLGELRTMVSEAQKSVQDLEENRLELVRKVDNLNTKLTKAYEDLKGAYETLKRLENDKQRSEIARESQKKARETIKRRESDTGDQL